MRIDIRTVWSFYLAVTYDSTSRYCGDTTRPITPRCVLIVRSGFQMKTGGLPDS